MTMPKNLFFEHMVRYFFGKKADNIAGGAANHTIRKYWYRKIIKFIDKKIQSKEFDLSSKDQAALSSTLKNLKASLRHEKILNPEIIDHLFLLCGKLLIKTSEKPRYQLYKIKQMLKK